MRWQDNGCDSAVPLDSSIFIPPATAVEGLLILSVELFKRGVEIIETPTNNPPPLFPTTVISCSCPFKTITSSPVFCTPTWNVISNSPPGGKLNEFLLVPYKRCMVP